MLKFQDKQINVTTKPVMLVGQNPGKARTGPDTGIVWESNRSADLLNEIVEGISNLYLTNLVNYQIINPAVIEEGLEDLTQTIKTYSPSKIICLGGLSYRYVTKLVNDLGLDIPVFGLRHPSFIVRFNKDRDAYANELLELIS